VSAVVSRILNNLVSYDAVIFLAKGTTSVSGISYFGIKRQVWPQEVDSCDRKY